MTLAGLSDSAIQTASRTLSQFLFHHRHIPVHILVKQIPERPRPASIAGLGAEGVDPHEIPGIDPILVQPIDRLALMHVKTVFHEISPRKRDHPAGLEGCDIDMHVMPQIVWGDEAFRSPCTVRFQHRGTILRSLSKLQFGISGIRIQDICQSLPCDHLDSAARCSRVTRDDDIVFKHPEPCGDRLLF